MPFLCGFKVKVTWFEGHSFGWYITKSEIFIVNILVNSVFIFEWRSFAYVSLFTSSSRGEYGKLFEFAKNKNLRMKNIGNKKVRASFYL